MPGTATNAGIGATGSELGLLRLQRECDSGPVADHHPLSHMLSLA